MGRLACLIQTTGRGRSVVAESAERIGSRSVIKRYHLSHRARVLIRVLLRLLLFVRCAASARSGCIRNGGPVYTLLLEPNHAA